MIEAVLFDGDQTLWDFERIMQAALVAVLDELRAARPGPDTSGLTVKDLSADRAAVAQELAGVEYNLKRLRVLGLHRTLERLPADEQAGTSDNDLVQHLADHYFLHRDLDPALFEDTLPSLNSLKAHYRLGLLSNGSRAPETIGLGGIFEVAVFAQDHQVAKPDRGIFEVVERQLGASPAGCVLVGDHRLNDVVGAKRSGWRAVWLDRVGAGAYTCPPGCVEEPDAVITSLSELPAVLEAW